MVFNVGDRIKVKKSGLRGQILRMQSTYYIIKWDDSPNECSYDMFDHWNEWTLESKEDIKESPKKEIIEERNTLTAMQTFEQKFPKLSTYKKNYDLKNECKHSWTIYHGLIESFKYCIHCDKKDENDA